jgi:hypothetical protein
LVLFITVYLYIIIRGRRGRDRMAVGFTTYPISVYHHFLKCTQIYQSDDIFCLMVLSDTFNNISVISWRRKPEDPEKIINLSQVTDKLYHIMLIRGRRGRDRMAVGFTTYPISVYHH